MLCNYAKSFINYIRQLPGFDNLCPQDFRTIVSQKLFTALGFNTTKLFVDNEYYLMLGEDFRFSKFVFDNFYGLELSEKIFNYHNRLNSLNLTDQEIAILIPFSLTSLSNATSNFFVEINKKKEFYFRLDCDIVEVEKLKDLNEFYAQIIFNEFSLNHRFIEFIDALRQVCVIFCYVEDQSIVAFSKKIF